MRVRYGCQKFDINRHTYTHINTVYIHCNRYKNIYQLKILIVNKTKKFSPPISVLLDYHQALLVERLVAHLFDLLLRPLLIYYGSVVKVRGMFWRRSSGPIICSGIS